MDRATMQVADETPSLLAQVRKISGYALIVALVAVALGGPWIARAYCHWIGIR